MDDSRTEVVRVAEISAFKRQFQKQNINLDLFDDSNCYTEGRIKDSFEAGEICANDRRRNKVGMKTPHIPRCVWPLRVCGDAIVSEVQYASDGIMEMPASSISALAVARPLRS
jgi:hypothetical protein